MVRDRERHHSLADADRSLDQKVAVQPNACKRCAKLFRAPNDLALALNFLYFAHSTPLLRHLFLPEQQRLLRLQRRWLRNVNLQSADLSVSPAEPIIIEL